MNPLTFEQAHTLPAGELAQLDGQHLHVFKREADRQLVLAKARAAHIHSAVSLKYAERAQQQRLHQGKDTGNTHFSDGQIRIDAELPKRVEWDQAQLVRLVERIRASGEDPTEFVDITYSINETRFNAWPDSIKSAFIPARTVRPGTPRFRLSLTEGNPHEGTSH